MNDISYVQEDKHNEDMPKILSHVDVSEESILQSLLYEENDLRVVSDCEGGLEANQEIFTLEGEIDKAFENQLTGDDSSSYFFSNDKDGNRVKEVSVQTTTDAYIPENYSCPICNFPKNNSCNLLDISVEIPSDLQCKVLTGSNTTEIFKEDEIEEDGLNSESSDDQVVPRSGPEIKSYRGGNTHSEPAARPIRIGLSKRTKVRPLHRASKSQLTESYIY